VIETWNREELYAEVWEQPLVKIAPKYGISAVMLGKICRQLLIPVPGRGYWAKKQYGKPVRRLPLPEGKNLPTLYRSTVQPAARVEKVPEPTPTDAEYSRIIEMESRTLSSPAQSKTHKLVIATRRCFQYAKPDSRGLLEPRFDQSCLDIRVSPAALDRALGVMNTIILTLEAEGFSVTLQSGKHGTGAQIFGHRVNFAIVEKVRQKARREVKEHSWTRVLIDYEPRGTLEFHAGDYSYGRKILDGKEGQMEDLLPKCVGALLREGRDCIAQAEQAKQWEIERQEKARQRLDEAASGSRGSSG
jgi:hypothetical protein